MLNFWLRLTVNAVFGIEDILEFKNALMHHYWLRVAVNVCVGIKN
jgi:hypothetical protein